MTKNRCCGKWALICNRLIPGAAEWPGHSDLKGTSLRYEGSVALITYMRTDSVHVSNDALEQVRELIPQRFGANYLPEKPNYYKSKKDAQEAHEAVRPTDAMRAPEDVRKYLDEDLFKLYQLIWQRFV